MQDAISWADDLKNVPLFFGLSEEGRQQVIDAMVMRSFDPDEVILRQGIITQNVWVLIEGRCEVVREPPLGSLGKTVQLAEIEPFETFGEMTMFAALPHCTSVWAKTDVKTIKLRCDDYHRLAELYPDSARQLACNLVNILSDRLRRMDEWITDLLDEREAATVHEQWTELRDRLQQTFQGHLF